MGQETLYLRLSLSVVLGIGAALCVILLILLARRRHRMVIRERSFPLLAISCIGNLSSMTITAIDGFLPNKSDSLAWSLFFLNLLAEYIFIAPYMLRLYHFKICYSDTISPRVYQRRVQRLTTRWFLKVLPWGLPLFFIVPVLSGVLYACNIPDCYPGCRTLVMYISWNLVCFCEAFPLVLALYFLRHTYEEFKIYSEIRVMCVVMIINSLLNLYQFSVGLYLIQECRGLVALYVSNFLPVYRSLDDRYELMLTPEVIESFILTLHHKEALLAFKEFLRDTVVGGEEIEEEVKADAYLHLYLAISTLPESPSASQLATVHSSYCLPILPHLPSSVHTSLSTATLPTLHSHLQSALERFFPAYLESASFANLEKRVEFFLRVKNRDQEILEEVINPP